MFDAIRSWFLSVKLEASFVKNEWSARRRHLEEAASRFDTANLEAEIVRAEASVAEAVEQEFGESIARAVGNERIAQAALQHAERARELLHRDFKAELSPLYEELNDIKAKLS